MDVAQRHLAARLANLNGECYVAIAERGFSYRADEETTVTFFPAYPLAGRWLARATGMRTDGALVVLSHVCLFGALVVMAAYVRSRSVGDPLKLPDYTLIAMGLLPTTFFFRMAYTEAAFLFLTALVLLGIERKWNVLVLAAIVGLATATRGVGIALVVPFALYAWARIRAAVPTKITGPDQETRPAQRAARWPQKIAAALTVAALVALSLWGLVAFSAFCAIEFDDPLAFAKAQAEWHLRQGDELTLGRKALGLAILEPIWSVYLPGRAEYWQRYDPNCPAVLSLQFANPIYFVGTALLIALGWRKGLLNRYELLAAAGLLLIPYLTKSYDNAMAGFGRFAAVAVPVYPVMGWLLMRMPPALRCVLLAISGFLLGIYSALFAAGYRFL
jgi:hypothetical protein